MEAELNINDEEKNVTTVLQNSDNLELTNTKNDEIDNIENETMNITSDEIENTASEEENSVNKKKSKKDATEKHRIWQLPLNKVKSIMKLDPDCHIVSKDAIFLTTKATELFLQSIGQETFKYTQMGKRKTVLKKDLDNAINNSSPLCFLDGSLEQLCS